MKIFPSEVFMKRRNGIAILIVLLLSTTLSAMETTQKVARILSMKKFQVELSMGFGLERISGFPERGRGVEALMRQYAEAVDSPLTEDGRIREDFLRLPLRIAGVYRLDPFWSVKAGLGFSSGSSTSEKGFELEILEVREAYDFTIQDRLTILSPFIEVERRFGRFSAYAGLGVQWGRLNHAFGSRLSMPDYNQETKEEIKATGIGPVAYLGGSYRHPLGEKIHLMARLEVHVSRINGWSGEKTSREKDSLGRELDSSMEGDLMGYEINAYGSGWVSYWDMGPISGDSTVYRNVSTLSSDFSGIRFTLGICF